MNSIYIIKVEYKNMYTCNTCYIYNIILIIYEEMYVYL